MRIWLLANFIFICNCKKPSKLELEGPELILQPSPVTHFSNSFGLTLGCMGRGHPPVTTSWLTSEGHPLPPIPGVREVVTNGTLIFSPFPPEDYIPAVHDAEYRCSVTNPVGTTLSPIFSVHTIVDEPFEIFITGADESDILEGNPTVLTCDVNQPTYRSFIKTIHWKSIDQYGHEREVESDGQTYQISSGGSLLILAAKYQQLFICVAQNTLNKKIQSSSPYLLKSKAGVGGLPPKSVGKWQRMIFTEIGKNIDLLCLAVGNPSPKFRWEKFHKGKFVPVISVENKGKIHGPLLSLDNVELSQNGTYRCESINSFGSLSVDVDLIVSRRSLVNLEPQRRVVRVGQNIELECKIPDNSSHAEITWFQNGKSLSGSDRLRLNSGRLSIFNIRYEDQGIYQCFTKIDGNHVGGTSNLVFESSEPELMHTFISQSLQPGPSVSLKCSAVGNPIPIISWFVDGKKLSPVESDEDSSAWGRSFQETHHHHHHQGYPHHRYSIGSYQALNEIISQVNISSVRVEDSGEYKCVASNLLASSVHLTRLNVYGSLFMKEMDPMTHVAGKTALIPCLYGGYPIDKTVWKLNGSEIDTKRNKSRFKILPNGTLQVETIKRDTDKGHYTCVVSNRKGESAEGTVSVNVLRPPAISSFSFDDNLQEGQRTSISCNVMSGDLPIEITWLKDFQPIPSLLNITAMRVKFLSYLIFEELKGEHSGIYTCSASNAAETVNFSAHLTVKVPPRWVREPTDTRALLKSDHIIPCQAAGVPPPRIKWFQESAVMRSTIRTDQKYQVLEDGSLVIQDVSAKDEAFYTCEGANGVGTGIQKSIRLSVIVPAQVSAPVTSAVVAEGLPALLKCQIRGDRPIQVVWRKNSIVIESSPRLVLQTVLDANSTVLSAELKIEQSERSDSGLYVCMGSNQYGRDEDAISLHVKARPRPPQDFIVEEIGSRFIRLKWSLSLKNLSTDPVTHFVLQYKNSSAISWDEFNNVSVQAPANQAVLRFLSPVTNYEIRILASNEIGHSLPSQPISVTTLAEAPSGPPLNVTAISTSSKSVLLTWEQPLVSLQNGAIQGYHVVLTPVSINSLANNNSVLIDEKWGHQSEIKNLKPNSRYRATVRAYNIAGEGPESPFISIATPEGAPDSPPLNVICNALSPKSLQVLWDPPPTHFSNGIIQGYKVIYQPLESEIHGEKPEVKKTINRETTLHGLQSYTNYSVRTLAYTLGGESSVSEPVFCTTEEDFPEEPADIKVLASGPNSAIVSWLPPGNPNGIIIKYKISWKSEDPEGVKEKYHSPSTEEDQLFYDIRRLKENKRYSFWVTAATSLGLGRPTSIQTVMISSKVPARIASFPVTKRPKLDQSVVLPCRAVGYPLPDITWLKGSQPLSSTHLMRNNSLFIHRVKDKDEGVYTCRVGNALGVDEIQHQISISRPPSSVSLVLGYVTANSIQIHWDAPSRSDPPLSGFVIQYRVGNSLDWTSKKLGSRLASFAMESLLCGTSYTVRMAGENSIGIGEFSSILRTKTNGGPPEYPKLTEVLDGNGTMIRVDLNRWPDGGCPVRRFHMEYKTKESQMWIPIYLRDNSTRVFILNTTLGSKYDVRIIVENEAGSVSKTFLVESTPKFFTNYDKLMGNGGERTASIAASYLTDPHIIVPVISAVICTTAVIICVLIVVKRKTAPREEWKLGHSSSQQTWLSSEDFRAEKMSEQCKTDDGPGNGGMSVYATLNSRKPIPMTIRDSTVRFQTFGQVENYDAPPMPSSYYGKTRGNSNSSSSHDELVIQEGYAINHSKPREPTDYRRRLSNPNEYSVDEICHEYAHPYQVVPQHRILGPPTMEDPTLERNTMKRKKHSKRSKGFPEY